LQQAGCQPTRSASTTPTAAFPAPTEAGNFTADPPGRTTHNQKRIVFMTHIDTVLSCTSAKPKPAGRKIVNNGSSHAAA
jgi:tripeptide aminopeptidase